MEVESTNSEVDTSCNSSNSVTERQSNLTSVLKHSVGLQRQFVKDKMIGQSICVHLANLVEPPKELKSRLLYHQHVGQPENSFKRNSEQLVVLYEAVIGKIDIEGLNKPRGTIVYMISGNHTHAALQSLVNKGTLFFFIYICDIYVSEKYILLMTGKFCIPINSRMEDKK